MFFFAKSNPEKLQGCFFCGLLTSTLLIKQDKARRSIAKEKNLNRKLNPLFWALLKDFKILHDFTLFKNYFKNLFISKELES